MMSNTATNGLFVSIEGLEIEIDIEDAVPTRRVIMDEAPPTLRLDEVAYRLKIQDQVYQEMVDLGWDEVPITQRAIPKVHRRSLPKTAYVW